MGNLKSAYEQEDEEIRLSPAMAIRYLQTGAISPARILSMLNVDDFHFMPRVDDRGVEPDVQTGFPCYTAPSTGVLALSVEDLEEQRKQGKNSVLFFDHGKAKIFKMMRSEKLTAQPKNMIFTFSYNDEGKRNLDYHIQVVALFFNSTLVDNIVNPQIELVENGKGIKLGNGQILRAGDRVTIDPVSGRLWAGVSLPIIPPSADAKILMDRGLGLSTMKNVVQVAAKTLQVADFAKMNDFLTVSGGGIQAGLYQTDMECMEMLACEDKEFFTELINGGSPVPSKKVKTNGLTETVSNYRLPDLHNIRDVLPDDLQRALDRKEDHKPGTSIFSFRENFYRQHLETVIRESKTRLKNRSEDDPINIIIPSIETAEEVRRFKEMVESTIPEEFKGKIKFGVMIETKAALDNIAEIAPLCDCLCIGTNDLTKELTGLDRSVLDYSEWMRERGYEGRSPFEVLVPEVYEPLAKALKIAREVNPGIFINACGHQVAGHDIGSIYRMLDMGVDQITVPPYEENFRRVELAVAVHAARNGLLYGPNSPRADDYCELVV